MSTETASGTAGVGARRPGARQRIRESRYGTVVVLAVTALLVALAATLVERPTGGEAGGPLTEIELTADGRGAPPEVGAPAQDFTAVTVEGRELSLTDLDGPVWLTFGASWCAACKAEAYDIQSAYTAHSDEGLTVVGVFINEDAATVRDYAKRVGLTFPAIADPGTEVASAYRTLGIPAHFFIDSDGIIRSIRTGTLSAQQIEDELAGLT